MIKKIVTNNIKTFIRVGESYSDFKEFCNKNNLKVSSEFLPTTCNQFVEIMHSPKVEEFAKEYNYEIVKVPLDVPLAFKNIGLKNLLSYYNK